MCVATHKSTLWRQVSKCLYTTLVIVRNNQHLMGVYLFVNLTVVNVSKAGILLIRHLSSTPPLSLKLHADKLSKYS